MDAADIELRNATYRRFVELGQAPTPVDLAEATGRSEAYVRAAWRRLHDAHALVLDESGRIRMANPFSGMPTPYRVLADGRSWYGNCAWDAFGICAAVHADGRIETTCPDCGDAIVVDVRDGEPDDASLRFHCLVPAARWWDDIIFT